jgi:hypothetical protein
MINENSGLLRCGANNGRGRHATVGVARIGTESATPVAGATRYFSPAAAHPGGRV